MAVTVMLDFLNESCVAVNSPCDTLVLLDHVSALPNSLCADILLIEVMQFFSFSLLEWSRVYFIYTLCTSTAYLWEESLLERYAKIIVGYCKVSKLVR